MADHSERVLQHPDTIGVVGARPHGMNGVTPADAVVTAYRPNGHGIPYVSDAPFFLPYNERATCLGTRSNGKPCNAKQAADGSPNCEAHTGQV